MRDAIECASRIRLLSVLTSFKSFCVIEGSECKTLRHYYSDAFSLLQLLGSLFVEGDAREFRSFVVSCRPVNVLLSGDESGATKSNEAVGA
eukprot:scaffold1769_cov132-Skeletonema_dohrnii-CCMP3373.AAC.27